MTDRKFDVVLFGATGFTGKLVAEYLSKHGPKDLRWCIAGRNQEKLEAVRRELDLGDDVPIRIADGHDEKALAALVPETRTVCTTVGPYAKHGVLLARIAAKSGTHYCDLTGEPQFIRRSIDENHEAAQKSGARVVHTCGFDSIPFDLGVFLLWDHAKKTGAKGLRWAKGFCGATKGGFSGGTIASMAVLFDEATKDKDVRRLLGDPHALDPVRPGRTDDPFEQDQRTVRFDPDLERWTAPFLMATVNTRVVRRSNALTPGHYGDGFKYQESMSLTKGPKGFMMATGITAALGGFAAALAFPATRKLIQNKLKPGDGPSKEQRENGYFKTTFIAETDDGRKIRSRVEGDGDPGYQETARMLGEAAMCLARDGDRLPKEPGPGVLTPATAMGMPLVDRLRAAGMRLDVEG
jgi:short subunit dehydrogenase-like uncharacterized protein